MSNLKGGLRWRKEREGWILVLTLALGVGVTSAFFALMDSTVLRPIPGVKDAEDLVAILPIHTDRSESGPWFSYADFRDYAQLDVFSGVAAFRNLQLTVTSGSETASVEGSLVSSNFFSVLGVTPKLGSFSGFEQDEPRIVVLSEALWQRWGADPNIVGQQIQISGTPLTVAAIASTGFGGIDQVYRQQFWTRILEYKELTQSPWKEAGGTTDRNNPWLRLIGRKAREVRLEQVNAAVQLLAASLAKEFSGSHAGKSAQALSLERLALGSGSRQKATQYLNLLFGAALLVLLVTCVNVGGVLLARTERRKDELAIRATLGASPLRLIRQALATMAPLAIIGGGMSLLLARALLPILEHLQLPNRAQPDLKLDVRVILFTLALAVLVGLLVGVVSLQRSVRVQPTRLLGGEGYQGQRLARVSIPELLACFQITLCFLVVLATLFLVQTIRKLDRIDLGFDPSEVLVARINLADSGYSAQQSQALYKLLSERLVSLPHVEETALAAAMPILGLPPKVRLGVYVVDGSNPADEPLGVNQALVDSEFFELLDLDLLQGRFFTDQEREGTTPAIVVNETLARQAWPDREAIGQQVQLAPGTTALTVVGVVRDAKHESPREQKEPTLYVAYQQSQRSMVGRLLHDSVNLLVKTNERPEAAAELVRSTLKSLDADLVVLQAWSLPRHIREFSRAERQTALIFGGFGGVALTLAMIGLYGALSRAITRRWHELGIRAAIGATPSALRRLVLGRTLILTSTGLLLGALIARPLSVALSEHLFNIGTAGPKSYLVTALLIFGLIVIVVTVPAWRAGRVQPNQLLRTE